MASVVPRMKFLVTTVYGWVSLDVVTEKSILVPAQIHLA